MVVDDERIDITQLPDVLRIAEEVRSSGRSRVLRRGGEDVAVIAPVPPTENAPHPRDVDARSWDDVGIAHPRAIWADYDPTKVKAALQRSDGALAGIDREV